MNLVRSILFGSVSVLSLSLAVGHFLAGHPVWVFVAIFLGIFWAFAHLRDWAWANSLSFLLFCITIVMGTFFDVAIIWLIMGVVSALVAWDISYWTTRKNRVGRIDREDIMVKQHLRRLGGVLVIGLGFSLLALNLHLTLTFGWILILGFVMILALSRVVSYLRDQ